MRRCFAAVLALVAAGYCVPAAGGGKADNKASVTVHLETEASDNPKMIFQQDVGGRTRYFRRVPEIATRDVVSFSPFPAEAGGAYGAVFRLKPNASRRLAAVTNANQGRWMVVMINGRVADGVLIDKQINDGMVVAWNGVNLADITVFDESMPRIGREKPGKGGPQTQTAP
jgi:hypothetical protein